MVFHFPQESIMCPTTCVTKGQQGSPLSNLLVEKIRSIALRDQLSRSIICYCEGMQTEAPKERQHRTQSQNREDGEGRVQKKVSAFTKSTLLTYSVSNMITIIVQAPILLPIFSVFLHCEMPSGSISVLVGPRVSRLILPARSAP